MAEPLKNHYGLEIPRHLAAMIAAVYPEFPRAKFLRAAVRGYEDLELLPRGRHLGAVMADHLPTDFAQAAAILQKVLRIPLPEQTGNPIMSFIFMPVGEFVATHGLEHFEEAMALQHALTQRFTAEFSIRPYLLRHQRQTMKRLSEWVNDPNEHVRRLVSEGTRPRLPWATRLPAFQRDPAPVLALLEQLKDDPSEYVRRSVANNLNDIGKDHPALLIATARKWLRAASPQRLRLINHALRSLIKAGDSTALGLLGFADAKQLQLSAAKVLPARCRLGDTLAFSASLTNTSVRAMDLLVDYRIHFVKASGRTTPKVFKLTRMRLAAGGTMTLDKSIKLVPLSTRTLYLGEHAIDLLVNGRVLALGTFKLLA